MSKTNDIILNVQEQLYTLGSKEASLVKKIASSKATIDAAKRLIPTYPKRKNWDGHRQVQRDRITQHEAIILQANTELTNVRAQIAQKKSYLKQLESQLKTDQENSKTLAQQGKTIEAIEAEADARAAATLTEAQIIAGARAEEITQASEDAANMKKVGMFIGLAVIIILLIVAALVIKKKLAKKSKS